MINTSPQEIDQKKSRKRKWETIITIVKGLNPRIKERTVDHGVSLIYFFLLQILNQERLPPNFLWNILELMKFKGNKFFFGTNRYTYIMFKGNSI